MRENAEYDVENAIDNAKQRKQRQLLFGNLRNKDDKGSWIDLSQDEVNLRQDNNRGDCSYDNDYSDSDSSFQLKNTSLKDINIIHKGEKKPTTLYIPKNRPCNLKTINKKGDGKACS